MENTTPALTSSTSTTIERDPVKTVILASMIVLPLNSLIFTLMAPLRRLTFRKFSSQK